MTIFIDNRSNVFGALSMYVALTGTLENLASCNLDVIMEGDDLSSCSVDRPSPAHRSITWNGQLRVGAQGVLLAANGLENIPTNLANSESRIQCLKGVLDDLPIVTCALL